MTDIFVAYARQDRETVRRIARALEAEGWDVWCDPSEPRTDADEIDDRKLSGAGAVLVIWSFNGRYADHVRSEAATGLYRNRLVQVRIDGVSPPRPFDQVEVTDLGVWGGGREDIAWQSLLSAVRRTAGPPGRAPIRATPEREPVRATGFVAPLLAMAVLGGAAFATWTFDPLGWRGERSITRADTTADNGRIERAAAGDLTRIGAVEEIPGATSGDVASIVASDVTVEAATAVEPAPASVVELDANIAEANSSADALAAQSLRAPDDDAWATAVRIATPDSYAAYLAAWPSGRHVESARAAMLLPQPSREPQLAAEVSNAVNAARDAAALADRQASAARARATEADRAAQAAADGAAGYALTTTASGLTFAGRVSGGTFTGPGVRTGATGDVQRYRGDLSAGTATGLGVIEFASGSAAQRYEGEVAGDRPAGSGLTVWADGGRFAGAAARGVLTYGDGRRYEGDMRDGAPEGKGALWSASDALLHAGDWSRGQPLPR